MAVKLAREALEQDPRNMEALNVIVEGALTSKDRSLLEQARARSSTLPSVAMQATNGC